MRHLPLVTIYSEASDSFSREGEESKFVESRPLSLCVEVKVNYGEADGIMRVSRNMKLAIVAVCVIVVFVFGLRRASPNRDDQKLREVQTVAFSLPVFSGFREVESSTNSGYTSASVTRRFKCISNCDAVNQYYSEVLGTAGWSRDSSDTQSRNEILFRKGDLSVSVFRSESSQVYDFALGTTWRFR